MEQNKLESKPFKQTFHITDIKHNIIGIPFIAKDIPTIIILNSRIHIKIKNTRIKTQLCHFFKEYTNHHHFSLKEFSFQHFQITQKEIQQLAELLLKHSMVYAKPKFEVGKVISPLHLPLKPDAVFKEKTKGKNKRKKQKEKTKEKIEKNIRGNNRRKTHRKIKHK